MYDTVKFLRHYTDMAHTLVSRRQFNSMAGLGLLLPSALLPTVAQSQSNQIRLVVPFPPGGGTDAVARLLAAQMEPQANMSVVVENRSGASGTIGISSAVRQAPDGRNLVLGQADNLAVAPLLIKGIPYDPIKDLKAVAHVADIPILIVTSTSQPYQTLGDVIAAGKKDPTLLTFGSAGVGTTPHLSGELLAQAAGVSMNHISYKGSAPALSDVLAGRVTLMMTSISLAVPHIQAGTLRPLAVTSAARSVALPDVPTVAEAGNLPSFDIGTWYGLFAPAGTPDETVETLNAQVNQALAQPEVKDFLEGMEGGHIRRTTPQALAELLRDDIPRWQRIIDSANIKL